jgi:hypothetical protein
MVSSADRPTGRRSLPAGGARRIRHALTLAAAAVLLAGSVAHAEPTPADRETARSLMQEGRDLRDKGHSQDALKRFKAADDIMHVPTTALEVARTQASLGMLLEARDTIANIRKLPAGPSEPAPFLDARAKADELDASLDGKIPSITIVVQGGAENEKPSIVVDGVPVPAAATGLPRRVNTGRHTIMVKTPSGHGEQTVDVHEGEHKEVQVALVGGADTTTAGGGEGGGAAGGEGGEPQPAKPEAPPEPTGPKTHSPTVLTWVSAGVGAAGAIAGTITGVMSMSLTSTIKSKGECPRSICVSGTQGGNDYNSASSLATISDVAFVIAGVGAGVAVATIVLGHSEVEAEKAAPSAPPPAEGEPPPAEAAPPPAAQSHLRVVPWIGLGSAGVVGSF